MYNQKLFIPQPEKKKLSLLEKKKNRQASMLQIQATSIACETLKMYRIVIARENITRVGI
jgi:hypothetical protein